MEGTGPNFQPHAPVDEKFILGQPRPRRLSRVKDAKSGPKTVVMLVASLRVKSTESKDLGRNSTKTSIRSLTLPLPQL